MTSIAAIQMEIVGEKQTNLATAERLIMAAAERGASLACLPEYFLADCPEEGTSRSDIEKSAETIEGPSISFLREVARTQNILVCAGTFIEKEEPGVYRNTSVLIGRDGEIITQRLIRRTPNRSTKSGAVSFLAMSTLSSIRRSARSALPSTWTWQRPRCPESSISAARNSFSGRSTGAPDGIAASTSTLRPTARGTRCS